MDDARTLTMSAKELNRLEILGRVLERRLTQAQAAERLGLGVRQVERLCRKLRLDGRQGLVSKKRGRPSNRKLSAALRERALALVQSHYADFGPTPGRREAPRAAQPAGLGRDAATMDDRSRTLGTSVSADASRSSAPASPIVLRRADPDRRLRSRVVRGSDSKVHPTRLRGRRNEPADGAALCQVRVNFRLLRSDSILSRAPRQARGLLQ